MTRNHPTVRSAERQAPNPPKSDLRNWLHSRCTSNFFVFDRRFLLLGKRLKKLTGLFLQDLINLACLNGTQWDGDWFRCTTGYLERASWSRKEQENNLKYLVRAGFLTLDKRGCPPERWVKINSAAIDSALQDVQWNFNHPRNGVIEHPRTGAIPYKGEEVSNKDTVAGAGAPGDGDGDDSMLIPDLNTRKLSSKQSPSSEALDRADLLHEALHKAYKCRGKWNRRSWGQWIALLLKEYGHERVDRVLDWYVAHVGQQYVPASYSARSFRDKFVRIEEAMARDQGRNPKVEVSAQAKAIVKRLGAYTDWPSPSKEELPTAVQLSLENFAAFRVELSGCDGTDPVNRFGRRLFQLLGSSGEYVYQWFEGVAEWIRRYPKARLIPKQVVALDNPRFDELCRNEANNYGDARLWDRLKESLK